MIWRGSSSDSRDVNEVKVLTLSQVLIVAINIFGFVKKRMITTASCVHFASDSVDVKRYAFVMS